MEKNKKLLSGISLFFILILSFNFMPDPVPVVYLIGDSTMADKQLTDNPERGWGQLFPYFFKDVLKIENHAVNGRSTKSFLAEGRWQIIRDQLNAGDFVFIQFGHNDAKESDSNRYAPAHTLYKNNLIKFVKETREKGAVPVLLTPVMRRRFDDKGKFYDVHGDYPSVVKEVSEDHDVYLIDLHEKSRALIVEHGEEKSKELFLHISPGEYYSLPEGKKDDTHFSIKGAYLIAKLVFDGVKENKLSILQWTDDKSGVGLLNGKNIFGVVNDDTSRGEINVFEIEMPVFQNKDYNVIDFGAIGDGITLNTNAINNTVKACAEAGGGKVIIPKGIWLTGPITLMSNVNLYVSNGAHLQFIKNFDHYPLVESDWEGTKQWRCQSPISGRNLKNVAITGGGIIDGGGDIWRYVKKSKLTNSDWKKLVASGGILNEKQDEWWPSEQTLEGSNYLGKFQDPKFSMPYEEALKIKNYFRPVLLSLIACENVLLDGPTFQNSAAWNLHPLECKGLIVRNITVKNPWYSQNGDGIDIEACDRVVLYNSSFDVGDDAVCIKSGRDEHGRERGLATQNLVIKDVIVYHGHGGFTIGSEMSGGANNIRVSNCNFIGTDVGLRFKSKRGRGGIVENIFIDNIFMQNIPTQAISLNMFYEGKSPLDAFSGNHNPNNEKEAPVDEGTPIFRKIFMENIFCDGAEDALFIQGLPEKNIAKIYLRNSVFKSKRAVMISEGEEIKIAHVKFIVDEAPLVNVSQSKNIFLEHIKFSGIDTFLKLRGSKSENVVVKCSEVNEKMIRYNSGAKKDAVQIIEAGNQCYKKCGD